MTTNANNQLVGFTGATTAGGLTTHGATSATLKTANTVQYSIDGRAYTKAATDPISLSPYSGSATAQSVLTVCLYLLVIDSSGNIKYVKGTEVLSSDLTNGNKALYWPACPDNYAPFGCLRITLASTATFTPGTTNLDASNVTPAYYDLFTVPSAPLTS